MRNGFLTSPALPVMASSASVSPSQWSRWSQFGWCRLHLLIPVPQGCDGNLAPCSWEDAIVAVAKALDSSPPEQIAAVAGGQADGEVSFDERNENPSILPHCGAWFDGGLWQYF